MRLETGRTSRQERNSESLNLGGGDGREVQENKDSKSSEAAMPLLWAPKGQTQTRHH